MPPVRFVISIGRVALRIAAEGYHLLASVASMGSDHACQGPRGPREEAGLTVWWDVGALEEAPVEEVLAELTEPTEG